MSNPDVKDEAGDRAMLIERAEAVRRMLRMQPGYVGTSAAVNAWMDEAIAALPSDAKDQRIAELEAERDKAVRLMNQWFNCHVGHLKALDALGAANGELFKRAYEDRQRAEAAEAQLRLTGTDDAGVRALDPDTERRLLSVCDSLEAGHLALPIGFHQLAHDIRAALTRRT